MSKLEIVKPIANRAEGFAKSISKILTDTGAAMKSGAKSMSQAPSAKIAANNLAKWGTVPVAIGAGGYIGLTGLSAGVDSLTDSVGKTANKITESTQSTFGWLLVFGLIAVIIFVFLPQLKKLIG